MIPIEGLSHLIESQAERPFLLGANGLQHQPLLSRHLLFRKTGIP
jgi:hypothetical protein